MKKVLIIINTSFVPYGGITTVIMNYYRKIDKSQIRLDIASSNEIDDQFKNELEGTSQYYNLGSRKNILCYSYRIRKIIEANKYDVVHVNGNSSTMLLELLQAKMKKVPLRIAHVHTSKTKHPLLNKILKNTFKKTYNYSIAVTKESGDWLFGSDYIILNNAIDVKYYTFNEDVRAKKRKMLGLSEDEIVLGTVGKLNVAKNQEFLLKVFEIVHRENKKTKLIIVGGGELEDNLKKLAKSLFIDDSVLFTGMVDDSRDYYQAFDFFALPSLYEGMCLALIEAQAAGLRCLVSSHISEASKMTDNVEFLNIENDYQEWADYILQNCNYNRKKLSDLAAITIQKHGFDIDYEANKLLNIYLMDSSVYH